MHVRERCQSLENPTATLDDATSTANVPRIDIKHTVLIAVTDDRKTGKRSVKSNIKAFP